MKQFKRAAATAALALVALLALVGSASAYDMSISPAGAIAATASSVTLSDSGGIIRVACPVTLDGVLGSGPIAITPGERFGEIDTATTGTCVGGTVQFLVADPYPMVLDTVLGTLPNSATGLLLAIHGLSVNMAVRVLGFTVNCLYSGSLGELWGFTGSNPYTSSGTITVLGGGSLPKASGSGSCPASLRLGGVFSVAPIQTFTVS